MHPGAGGRGGFDDYLYEALHFKGEIVNLYIKKFIDHLVSKSLLKESDITADFRGARYPVDAVSTLQGVVSACFSPDCYESADEIVEGFSLIADGGMTIRLIKEGETDDGEYEVLFHVDGKEVLVKEPMCLLAYYKAISEIIDIFNGESDLRLVVDAFSGEEVFCVLIDKNLADFVNEYQKNINYDELNTEV